MRILSFILTMVCLTITSGLASNQDEKDLKNYVRPSAFHTATEMLDFGTKIYNLCNDGNYDEVERLAFPMPTMNIAQPTVSDASHFFYCYYYSLGTASLHKGDQARLNPEDAKSHYQKATSYFNNYITHLGKAVSKIPEVYERILEERIMIYKSCGTAFYHLFNLTLPKASSLDYKTSRPFLEDAITCIENEINFRKKCTLLDQHESLAAAKFKLFDKYQVMMALCSPQERSDYYQKAKALNYEFSTDASAAEYYRKSSQALDAHEKQQQSLILNSKSGGSKRVKKLRNEKRKELEKGIKDDLVSINTDLPKHSNQIPLEQAIIEAHSILLTTVRIAPTEGDIEEQLKGIETQIEEELFALGQPSSLSDIYTQYEVFIGSEALRKHMVYFILPAYLSSGDVTSALERVNILAQLELSKIGNNSTLTRVVRAAIKSMNGDISESEELEKEAAALIAKRAEKKQRKQQQRHSNEVEAIKLTQEQHQDENPDKSLTTQVTPTKEKRKTPPSITNEYVDTTPSSSSSSTSSTSSSDIRAWQEKLMRHEESERMRQEQAMSSSSQTSQTPVQNVPQNTAPPLVTPVISQPLHELYELRGVAKTVDQEIEDATWKISREELKAYFEFLGCTAINGGKHAKVKLPESLIITHNGKTLTIINDLGGALTLPRWDGAEGNGTVPKYLRQQILDARMKLVEFKLKQNKAMQ